MSDGLSNLDSNQVIRKLARDMGDGTLAQGVSILNSLVPNSYNSIELSYVASGNGVGEVETVVYKNNGTTIATLTLTYDASNRLASVTRN